MDRREHWYLGDYGSDLRDTALIERHNIAIDGKDRLLFKLGAELNNRPYLSTRERLAIVLAGMSALKSAGSPWIADITIGSRMQSVSATGRFARVFRLEDLRKGISFTSKNRPILYAEIEVTGYPAVPPRPKLKIIR
jgi:uncharacterized protein YfaS (alpha-2-macroglobulin family)